MDKTTQLIFCLQTYQVKNGPWPETKLTESEDDATKEVSTALDPDQDTNLSPALPTPTVAELPQQSRKGVEEVPCCERCGLGFRGFDELYDHIFTCKPSF